LRKHKNYKIFLSREDRLKLEQAKRIIVDNMLDPLSVAELALQIDLNVYKLKVGFKEMWGTTIFGYLRDMRMEKARFLLSGTHKNVAEVAQEVGYSNPSHFSTAFRKKYGINPHEYANHYRSL
jgi:AraC-like DNA-binding protein